MEIESKPLGNSYGNLKIFCFLSGEPLFCIGPHCTFYLGPFFLCLYTFFLLIALLFISSISPSIGSNNLTLGTLLFGFLLINYLFAALINPGIETRKEPFCELESIEQRFCSRCEVYQEEKTEHCDDCEVCIQNFDHHCPWTSKCIGRGNLCFFYNFLIGIVLCFIFCIASLAMIGNMGSVRKAD